MAYSSNEYRVPPTMKAWVLGGPDELLVVEKPVPEPEQAEVLLRIDAIAVCATDLEISRTGTVAGDPSPSGSTTVTYVDSAISYDSTTAPTNPGTYSASVDFTSTDPNYTDATGSGSITINPATPTVTVSGDPFNYDGNPHAATVTAMVRPQWIVMALCGAVLCVVSLFRGKRRS